MTQQASRLRMEKDQAASARHELEMKVQMLERQKKVSHLCVREREAVVLALVFLRSAHSLSISDLAHPFTQALEAESGFKDKYEKLLELMVDWRKIYATKVAELDDLHSALGELLKDGEL